MTDPKPDPAKADAAAAKEETARAERDGGAPSSILNATSTEVTQDDLNPAFAGPEAQEKTTKDWTEGAEHTVDAEAVDKEAQKDAKDTAKAEK